MFEDFAVTYFPERRGQNNVADARMKMVQGWEAAFGKLSDPAVMANADRLAEALWARTRRKK